MTRGIIDDDNDTTKMKSQLGLKLKSFILDSTAVCMIADIMDWNNLPDVIVMISRVKI
jgi:hypothetical protein